MAVDEQEQAIQNMWDESVSFYKKPTLKDCCEHCKNVTKDDSQSQSNIEVSSDGLNKGYNPSELVVRNNLKKDRTKENGGTFEEVNNNVCNCSCHSKPKEKSSSNSPMDLETIFENYENFKKWSEDQIAAIKSSINSNVQLVVKSLVDIGTLVANTSRGLFIKAGEFWTPALPETPEETIVPTNLTLNGKTLMANFETGTYKITDKGFEAILNPNINLGPIIII